MKLLKTIVIFVVILGLVIMVFNHPPAVKYDHVSLNNKREVEIYFLSDKTDFGNAYNIACSLSDKTKYPNIFPEDGVAIYGKVIKKVGEGKFKASVYMDGFSKSGQYSVGKYDIERELNGAKKISCVIYQRGFFTWGSVTDPIDVPVQDLYSVMGW
ncbi:hypothetical protein [Chromobacterium vaccinii]|uniref:hypothetical protein n=1 Tax=Chromobacterium vaccinii TaxID=1108595 RepID=UPI0011C0566A|nr:hypothetical protein [Chromobacterium vaccinii]